ncbi:endonuclease domain-containing protein [Azospirillum sp.]|uniref:endonuclease domain-containing protein n=1 Tax=Azospirillum sp. TaxID=34012 RepID=UPI003D744E3E
MAATIGALQQRMRTYYLKVAEYEATMVKCGLLFCESFIEVRLGAYLLSRYFEGLGGGYFVPRWCGCELVIADDFTRCTLDHDGYFVDVYTQAVIGQHRVDFLVVGHLNPLNPMSNFVVVECDGHDFHEKTKEQAKRDKRRDRDLQKQGYSVLRFTGSEIFIDPEGCVREIFEHLAKPNYPGELLDRACAG